MPLPIRNCHHRSQRQPLLSLLRPGILEVLLFALAITITGAFVPADITHRQTSFCPRRSSVPVGIRSTKTSTALCIGKSDNNDGLNADLLEKARRLREEASLLEDDLRATTGAKSSTPSSSSADAPVAVVNTQLEESTWTLTYRFSSQPPPKDSDKNNEETPKPTKFYSGKINLLLKEDGYSEEITDGKTTNEGDIKIVKIWGWDRETSNEDNLDYLLFSMDVKFPPSDPDLSNQQERYYFQARIEQENGASGSIALKEGTITTKKDVTEKTGGMWGLFNVAGILTEFRYCGDFVARASQ